MGDNHIFTIGMSSNVYDSRHETKWGGACPGTNSVQCTDDPDNLKHTWSNSQGTTQRVYFIIDAYSSGAGSFTLTWNNALITNSPTTSPTNSPTNSPTPNPTNSPTPHPTNSPTP